MSRTPDGIPYGVETPTSSLRPIPGAVFHSLNDFAVLAELHRLQDENEFLRAEIERLRAGKEASQ